MTDNRQHPRQPFDAEVSFQVGGGPRVPGRCRDLSLGGMFIETEHPLPYGTAVHVFLKLPALKTETEVASVVRWMKPTGMGVQFGVMGARETHALTEVLTSG